MPFTMTNPEPWRQDVVAWYAGGPTPNSVFLRHALDKGLPLFLPAKPKDRVRLLWMTGFDDEDLVAAVPELDADLVLRVAAATPSTLVFIFSRHLEGRTPLEISRNYALTPALTRPRVYYWLNKLGLEPHRQVREVTDTPMRAAIVGLYARGDRMSDIASRLNVSYDQVRYAVKIAEATHEA